MQYKKRCRRSTLSRSAISTLEHSRKPVDHSWNSWKIFVRDEYQRSKIDALFSTIGSDPRPYLKVSVYGINLVGLLDSGASQTVVGRAGWQKLSNLKLPLEKSIHSVSLANGKRCDILGVVNLPINLSSKVRLVKCLVVLDIPDEIMLGIDFWRDMDILPSMRDYSWEFGNSVNYISSVGASSPSDDINLEQRKSLENLVRHYFDKMGDKLGCAVGVRHVIDTGDSPPIKQRYYPVSPYMQRIINQEIDDMLASGVIEPSKSAWSSPVVMVKKSSGDYRFCIDFRKVNMVTRRDAYPLPYVSHILDRLSSAKYFSSIDIKSAYHQILLDESSKDKTAFTVPSRGLYQFVRMPFGLHNSAASWQRLIDNVLGPELENFVFVYLDDIIIATPDFETHLKTLQSVFEKLLEAGLTVNQQKCEFLKSELKYLGYRVTKEGLQTDPEKIESMVNYPTPKRVKDVRRFVGMVSWYRRFVPNFSSRIRPLTNLTRKNCKFVWSPECEVAFQEMKQLLISSPILSCPDFSREFVLQCDASQIGLGCVLTQNFDDGEKIISYASRTLTPQESRYSATELECLALLFGIEKFRPYIEGTKFSVITDHSSLKWLYKLQNPSGRLARWALRLQGYDFEIIHRKGKSHLVPDALSRAIAFIDVGPDDNDGWYRKLKSSILSYPEKYPKWSVRDNKIYKLIQSNNPSLDEESDWKLVVPKNLRRAILLENHDEPSSGHLGYFKTRKRISNLYYWPGMNSDILRYVRSCDVCKAQKPEQKVPHGVMSSRKISKPWEVVSTDLIGPLPLSYKRNRYVLVVTDLFTKYTLLFPLKSATSESCVKYIEEHVFMHFGVPERLICDNGKQYVSKAFKKMCASYDCRIVFNAQYSPQANPTERVNRVLKTMIRSYLKKDQREWDKKLHKLGYALRTSVHEVTGYSPSYLNFGREVYLSGKMYRRQRDFLNNNPIEFALRSEWASHVKDVQELCSEVQNKLKQAYDTSADRYNLRRRPLSLDVGQIVWKRNKQLSDAADFFQARLAPKFVKCRVVKKISTNVYELSDFESGRSYGCWHIKDIKVD